MFSRIIVSYHSKDNTFFYTGNTELNADRFSPISLYFGSANADGSVSIF